MGVHLKSTKNYFAQGVPCEPEALIVAAIGGLVNFMSICKEIPVKICVGALFNQQQDYGLYGGIIILGLSSMGLGWKIIVWFYNNNGVYITSGSTPATTLALVKDDNNIGVSTLVVDKLLAHATGSVHSLLTKRIDETTSQQQQQQQQ
ncbi:hypothetical protein FRACYDRAFT_237494 [Fragilariopsis cylindrus CCMP1102]|uniref:Uncharacterized protein n=1 Tax=Fragilariopsis cylindrus CCMP1102 TaxID=635003 RepID=A0A1E7FM51_9STRA|nr:hypothetical protein FRACYDRAFT_237494 [Fragilariopsis cylindrus CCMP1102]|eukprot:OEU19204.1 hypothetical protein FRACYDRAFT_237494 [Fragilariopsis cylindrus CCMP1102]